MLSSGFGLGIVLKDDVPPGGRRKCKATQLERLTGRSVPVSELLTRWGSEESPVSPSASACGRSILQMHHNPVQIIQAAIF